MNIELKQAIINFIFENTNDFQVTNATTQEFREYIYTSKGDFLIGGANVVKFIEDAIKLTKN